MSSNLREDGRGPKPSIILPSTSTIKQKLYIQTMHLNRLSINLTAFKPQYPPPPPLGNKQISSIGQIVLHYQMAAILVSCKQGLNKAICLAALLLVPVLYRRRSSVWTANPLLVSNPTATPPMLTTYFYSINLEAFRALRCVHLNFSVKASSFEHFKVC